MQQRLTKISNRQKHGNYLGATIMGCLATLILSPCVTPPLVGALTYISQTGNAVLGGIALFMMAIGMGIPLLIIGAFSTRLLPRTGNWMNIIKYILGVSMLIVAIWMMARILPEIITMMLWAALTLGCAIALGALQTAITVTQKIAKSLGIVLFIYGIVLVIGGFTGSSDPLQPLNMNTLHSQQTQPHLIFIPVNSIAAVEKQLHIARNHKQPVILDFYADWCIACKAMEAGTFSDIRVKKQLHSFRLLRADVSKNSQTTKILQNHFGVIAPPTILFFAPDGKEITNARIVGEISATHFLHRVHLVKNDHG